MWKMDPVKLYIDTYRSLHGFAPPKDVSRRVGAESNKLTREGIPDEAIEFGIKRLAERGGQPNQLPVFAAEGGARTSPHGRATEALRAFLELHDGRWPTGARFVRGTHSGTFMRDPLGYDRAPPGFAIERPTREEIVRALMGTTASPRPKRPSQRPRRASEEQIERLFGGDETAS